MAEDEATDKQLAKLKQLSGKDYSEFNLTKREASRKIEELLGTKAPAKTGYKADPAKTSSIERQVSLKGAIELSVADKIKTSDILTYADWFNAWLTVGFKVEKPAERQSPITPKLTLDMDWLSESVKKIWKTYKAFVQFLGERYSVAMDGSVKDVLDRLSQPQQAELLKEIEERLNKTS